MLILSRRPGEIVHLYTSDGIIKIQLHDCNDRVARLGFAAPLSVTIMRAEIDDTDVNAENAISETSLAKPQRKTIFSLVRELFTRGSTGLH